MPADFDATFAKLREILRPYARKMVVVHDTPDNYYLEREWRLVGNLRFGLGDLRTIVVPRSYAERLATDFPEYSGQRLLLD